jgi:hypothetical protein
MLAGENALEQDLRSRLGEIFGVGGTHASIIVD